MILTLSVIASVLVLTSPVSAQQSKARYLPAMKAKKARSVEVSYKATEVCTTGGCGIETVNEVAIPSPRIVSQMFDRASQAFAEINAFRQQYGRGALTFADASGCEANNRLQERFGMGHHRHGFSHNGECAATSNYSDNPTRAVTQWINSPGHRAILLKDGVDRGAIAITDRFATFQVFRSNIELKSNSEVKSVNVNYEKATVQQTRKKRPRPFSRLFR
jgi:uncharacterized protein YkwD